MTDLYEILEVARSADSAQIREAITKQRRIWVRRQSSPDPARRARAEDRVREIDRAEKTLLDPEARAAFDRQLGARAPAGTAPRVGSGPSQPGGSGAGAGSGARSGAATGPASGPAAGAAAGAAAGPGTAPTGPMSAEQWRERARDFTAQSNHLAANRAAREAVAVDPSDPDAWRLLAGTSAAAGRLADAAYEYAEALRLREEPEARLGLADVYARQENWRGALGEYDAVLAADADELRARVGRAEVLVHSGPARERREGLRTLQGIARAHPEDEHVRTTLAYALYNDALASLAGLRDGTRLPVTARQVRLVRRRARRIKTLGLSDPEVETMRNTLLSLAREARRKVWVRGGRMRFYLVPAVPLILLALFSRDSSLVYLWSVLIACLVALYIVRHRQPAWKFRLTELRTSIVDKGI